MERSRLRTFAGLAVVASVAVIATSRTEEPTRNEAPETSLAIKDGVSERPTPPLSAEESTSLTDIRASAISGDHSKTTQILAALARNHDTYVITGLHAAARLAVEEALPRIDAIAATYPAIYVRNHAIASRARLRAESAVTGQADSPQKAASKIQALLRELRLGTQQVNSAVAAFERSRTDGDSWPVELYALREAADMVYAPIRISKT